MPAGARVQRARDRAAVKVDGTAGMGPLALPTCSAQDRSVVSRGGGAGIGLLASIAVGRNDRKHRLRRSALSRPRLLLASLSSSLGPKHRKSEESEREQRRCVIPRTVDARATSTRSFVAARLTDHDPDSPIARAVAPQAAVPSTPECAAAAAGRGRRRRGITLFVLVCRRIGARHHPEECVDWVVGWYQSRRGRELLAPCADRGGHAQPRTERRG